MLKCKKRNCEICGKLFQPNNISSKLCSEECRTLSKERTKRIQAKKKKYMREIKGGGKLDKTVRECRNQGLSYAEMQKNKTLALVGGINTEL